MLEAHNGAVLASQVSPRAAARTRPHMWWGVLMLVIVVAGHLRRRGDGDDGPDDRSPDHRDLHRGVLLALRLLTRPRPAC